MFRKRQEAEWLPWYRRHDYKGDLTEAEKRVLDAYRMQDKHPATQAEDLSEEVQQYIGGLELEIYDDKQVWALNKATLGSAIGALIIWLSYKGYGDAGHVSYVLGVLLLAVPWLFYRRKWRQNADEFLPDLEISPNPTDEALRVQWELNHIARTRARD